MSDRDFVVKNGLTVSNSVLKIVNNVGISAQGTLGAPGQKLTSNGSAVMWTSDTGQVNTYSTFTWNAPQYYSATITLNSSSDLIFNNGATIYAAGSPGTPGSFLMSDGNNLYWGAGGPPPLVRDQNLADVPNKAAARANLALGDAAIRNVGLASGQVAPGDVIAQKDGTGAYGTWNISVAGSATTFTSTSLNAQFNSVGIGVGASGSPGDFRATGDVTAFFSSDRSLKENIKPIEDALNKIMYIEGVEYDWIQKYIDDRGGEDGYFVRRHDVGVIAQKIEKVLPEAVVTRPNGIKAVRYDKLAPLLIQAVKELKQELDELKKSVKK